MEIFVQTTDAGSDQAGARRIIASEVLACLCILHFQEDCLSHQNHLAWKRNVLVSESSLKFLGSECKYFPSIAKVVNIWRDSGRAIFD